MNQHKAKLREPKNHRRLTLVLYSTSEGTYVDPKSNTTVSYRFRPALDDRRHLVVVLSGFRNPVHSVDFVRSSASLTANILWIYDDIDDVPGYYLWGKGLKDLGAPIHATIQHIANQLGLTSSQITLFGLSKGANAAVIYGPRYGYKNIVASAPRALNGSSMRKDHPEIFAHVTNQQHDADMTEHHINQCFTTAIDQDVDTNRSIYMFTSPEDVTRYFTESTVLSAKLDKYDNFNLIHTRSPLLQNHHDVTRYNLSILISILTQLSDGLVPTFSGASVEDDEFVARGGSTQRAIATGSSNIATNSVSLSTLTPPYRDNELRAAITKLTMNPNGLLKLQGYAILNNVAADRYKLVNLKLRLENVADAKQSHWYPLGSTRDRSLNKALFSIQLIDYTYGGIATLRQLGVQLAALPIGRYRVNVELEKKKRRHISKALPAPVHTTWINTDERLIGSESNGHDWHITSTSSIGRTIRDCQFEIDELRAHQNKLIIKGTLAPHGMDASDWNSISYYLVLRTSSGPKTGTVTRTYKLANSHKAGISNRTHQPWRDQSKAHFTTPDKQGINLGFLPSGYYEIIITGRRGSDIFSVPVCTTLRVQSSNHDHTTERSSLSIISSKASSLYFNEGPNADWADYWNLGPVSSSLSLVELMTADNSPATHELGYNSLAGGHDSEGRLPFGIRLLDEIRNNKPDYLLVDLAHDVLPKAERVNNHELSERNSYIGGSDLSQKDDDRPSILDPRTSSQYRSLFRSSCEALSDFMNKHSPNTTVILHDVRASQLHRGIDSHGGVFDRRHIKHINDGFRELGRIFESVFDPELISVNDDEIQSDTMHCDGVHYLHFEALHRSRLMDRLFTITNRSLAIDLERN